MSAARCKVLIVEDEALVAMMIEDLLADLGCEVGDNPVRLDEALAAAQSGEFDMALLDLNLAGSRTYPVADLLAERGIPFAFLTGYRSEDLEAAYRDTPILAKPFRRADLQAMLTRLLDSRQQA
jgi:CheY-like chemotaxis protein